MTLYNYFEHVLNKICEWIGKEVGSHVGLEDISGRGITHALLVLDRIPEFKFDRIPEIMAKIGNSNLLRNVIVHAGTVLPQDLNHRLNQFVKSHPHLGGKAGEPVSLKADFVSDFAATLHAFFEGFEAQMQAYMDRSWRKVGVDGKSI